MLHLSMKINVFFKQKEMKIPNYDTSPNESSKKKIQRFLG